MREKPTKEEKRELREGKNAFNRMVRKAMDKEALIELSDESKVITCPICGGDGEMGERTMYYGEEGMQIAADVPIRCDLCNGEGKTTKEKLNEYNEKHDL